MFSRMVLSQMKHNSYFVCGLALGLWLALVAVPLDDDVTECPRGVTVEVTSDVTDDELATQPPLKQAEAAAARGEARALQRPRYYTTELGIRAPLLVAVLTSQEQLDIRIPALNTSLSPLGPAVRWFLSARTALPARQGLVAFTDTREMLRPFHVIKYLADNHLDDYDFFLLTLDSTFINSRALLSLVKGLGVSGHVYMGAKPDQGEEYCTLEGGILISRSVLSMVHSGLDWCVRNSYSSRHHENLARCVLHATSTRPSYTHKGMEYTSVEFSSGWTVNDAITVRGVETGEQIHQIHALVSRLTLERVQSSIKSLSRVLTGKTRWPTGLRTEVGLPESPPDNRFDVYRWALSNGTHWLMPDEERAVGKLPKVYKEAIDAVVSRAKSYLSSRHIGILNLVEVSWLWRPATDLNYRVLFAKEFEGKKSLIQAEVSRPLGSGRLVSVPYVTESVRVTTVRVTRGTLPKCRVQLANTRRILVAIYPTEDELSSKLPQLKSEYQSLPPQCRGGEVLGTVGDLGDPGVAGDPGVVGDPGVAGDLAAALRVVKGAGVSGDSLVLVEGEDVEYTDEFLNRVRMNVISGVSWFLPSPRARSPLLQSPAIFTTRHNSVFAFYYKDYELARAMFPSSPPLSALLLSPLRCHRAPDPALWRAPTQRPQVSQGTHVSQETQVPRADLSLGTRTALATEILKREAGFKAD